MIAVSPIGKLGEGPRGGSRAFSSTRTTEGSVARRNAGRRAEQPAHTMRYRASSSVQTGGCRSP